MGKPRVMGQLRLGVTTGRVWARMGQDEHYIPMINKFDRALGITNGKHESDTGRHIMNRPAWWWNNRSNNKHDATHHIHTSGLEFGNHLGAWMEKHLSFVVLRAEHEGGVGWLRGGASHCTHGIGSISMSGECHPPSRPTGWLPRYISLYKRSTLISAEVMGLVCKESVGLGHRVVCCKLTRKRISVCQRQ